MSDNEKPSFAGTLGSIVWDTLGAIFGSLARTLGMILACGVAGTAIGAGVCLYYGFPLIFSLAGGAVLIVVAVGIALALQSESLF